MPKVSAAVESLPPPMRRQFLSWQGNPTSIRFEGALARHFIGRKRPRKPALDGRTVSVDLRLMPPALGARWRPQLARDRPPD